MKLSDLEILVQQMRQYATENGRGDPLVDFWIQNSEHLSNNPNYLISLQIEEGVCSELHAHVKYAKHCEGDYSIPLKIVG